MILALHSGITCGIDHMGGRELRLHKAHARQAPYQEIGFYLCVREQ